jgi:large subunit ribosomal protein L13e
VGENVALERWESVAYFWEFDWKMKHNNVLPNVHFHKDWQRYVKTWFNQPAKRKARRAARLSKAKKIAPRPLKALRPVVRGPTIRYNLKLRLGRGFTLDEIEAAGFTKQQARTTGIAVDCRRRNKTVGDFQRNVDRLRTYKQKLVLFPKKANSKRVKKGDSTKEQLAKAVQVTDRRVLAFQAKPAAEAPKEITANLLDIDVWGKQRNEKTIAKRWGLREKRAKDKAEQGEKDKKKKAKKGDDEE